MKSIIFNQHQVNHALKNKEGMFRVVVKPQPIGELLINESWSRRIAASCGENNPTQQDIDNHAKKCSNVFSFRRDNGLVVGKLAPYQVGQKIFCKEPFGFFENGFLPKHIPVKKDIYTNDLRIAHKASFTDSEIKRDWKWKTAQHMKQEHSRLTLQIKEIRVERLQDISEKDCLQEGVYKAEEPNPFSRRNYRACEGKNFVEPLSTWHYSAQDAFKELWNSTHKKPEEKWEANPWVWCVNFEVVK